MRENLVTRIRSEFDWVSYLEEHFSVKRTPSDELRICCFSCEDNKYKLYVNPTKGVFFCFKCPFSSKKYDLFDFVAKTENITRGQATAKLIREYSSYTPEDLEEYINDAFQTRQEDSIKELIKSIKEIPGMPEGLEVLSQRTEASAPFWDYLLERGLTVDEIHACKFHFTSQKQLPIFDSANKYRGDLANRVVVPIYGGAHKLVSWQGRIVIADKMKYLTAPSSEISKTFWPYIQPNTKHVVLVEGIFDCLAVLRIPSIFSYATFSKKISIDQIMLLKSWGVEEITLFWDKRDAKKEMLETIPELHMYFKKVFVSRMTGWPKEKDAGNMLADSQGSDKLIVALKDIVDTYDYLEYAKWNLLW